jgi:8-oxo-dGTP pyrophosphatase MutT (NUDIX family)
MNAPQIIAMLEKASAGTAWVILYTPKKLILGKRAPGTNNAGLWNFFGGHIDPGENPAQAAAREVGEEIRLQVDPSQLRHVSSVGSAHYFALRVGDLSGASTTDEISRISKFPIADLPKNLHAKTAQFFDNLETLLD